MAEGVGIETREGKPCPVERSTTPGLFRSYPGDFARTLHA